MVRRPIDNRQSTIVNRHYEMEDGEEHYILIILDKRTLIMGQFMSILFKQYAGESFYKHHLYNCHQSKIDQKLSTTSASASASLHNNKPIL